MALPALQWRMLPPVVVTSTTQPSFILDNTTFGQLDDDVLGF